MQKGTRHTEAAKFKQSFAARGENNPLYGRHHRPETIAKIRRAAKRLWKGTAYRRRVAEGQRHAVSRRKPSRRSHL